MLFTYKFRDLTRHKVKLFPWVFKAYDTKFILLLPPFMIIRTEQILLHEIQGGRIFMQEEKINE